MLKKYFGLSQDQFTKYVICSKCESLYEYKDCFQSGVCNSHPKVCGHIAFRNHPHLSRRQPCGHTLLKQIVTKQGKKYYPHKLYCYRSVITSLKEILSRKDYLDKCELWRGRKIPDGLMGDIYDGRVWNEFCDVNGQNFFLQPHHLGLMLNCDWFQPYRHTNYSIGVLYLVILNLPRSMRFKPENILIAGIIPGPSEPKTNTLNSYLRPLVKELNFLWTDGFMMKCSSNNITVRAALIASVCDIPATQKLGGFLGHNSHHACWKCSKYFPYSETLKRVDFAGSDTGCLRTHDDHKTNAIKTLKAVTQTERNLLESQCGSRFTELMHLPYYNCIRFSIIDPMHNMFLGTTKRLLQNQWIGDNILCRKDLSGIQKTVDKCILPGNFGRIPRKIESEFASLTADEWKNWTNLFSLIALHGILPADHLECWQLFVQACTIYCSPYISLEDINTAHALMTRFFTLSESLYGSSFLTLNMHLHLHLKDCYMDYGPCYGFWLFSFERYNGLLGHYPTNQLSIEIQLMRRFIDDMSARSLAYKSDIPVEHQSFFTKLLGSQTSGHGTSNDTIFGQNTLSNCSTMDSLTNGTIQPSLDYITGCPVELISPFTLHKFDDSSLIHLKQCYLSFLPEVDILEIPTLCRKYKLAQWWSHRLGNYKNTHKNPTCIQAYWAGKDGNIENECCSSSAGLIEYFFSQKIMVKDEYRVVVMAKVKWLEEHPSRYTMLKPVEIWHQNIFKPDGPASFMPLVRLHRICVMCDIDIDGESLLAVNPITPKVFL